MGSEGCWPASQGAPTLGWHGPWQEVGQAGSEAKGEGKV